MIRLLSREVVESEPVRPLRPLVPAAREAARPASDSARALLHALLLDELTLAPSRVRELSRRELDRVRGAGEVELRVHPDDLAQLDSPEVLAADFELTRLRLCEDATITRGGCLISCERGELDARVETRVERILALLRSERA